MLKKALEILTNPTLQYIFAMESQNLALATANIHAPCRSDYKDIMYGDLMYADLMYGDITYGDMFTNRKRDGGGGGCFTADTPVLTPFGIAKINMLQKGDIILSWNETSQQFVERKVQKVIIHKPQNIFALSLDNGFDPVKVTGNHTIQTLTGWKQVKEIELEDKLLVVQNGVVAKASATALELLEGKQPVYNLHTEGEHSFIAGGLIAHNFTQLRELRTLAHRFVETAVRELSPKSAALPKSALG